MAPWTYYGSSSVVCRATCIFCRYVVSTCSNKWPETKGFSEVADAHCKECARTWWLNTVMNAPTEEAHLFQLRESGEALVLPDRWYTHPQLVCVGSRKRWRHFTLDTLEGHQLTFKKKPYGLWYMNHSEYPAYVFEVSKMKIKAVPYVTSF